ncbi:phosphoenolpyruvate--protein phosphotransferase [Vibrio sp. SCSIO 43137]|uniref:phosphoenolpyruvate--protein phosphotransferase n=1 Tax=Vibrio sp. SCSIO 43137 TaxID=3021011 RepID=UPI002307567F|nr:phosphoenolpyruvate--protein phosphotransferase [Vibrio sp. SCSIO 43137]WCE32148.1 phosphoenolpyruvate--protein phosphotransferase [Vibrio sp. SCSIO 43137]
MVGIVVVSHSEMLADGVVLLANQMTQGRCKIAAAGGIDDPENPIGTDAVRIMMAIEEVYEESGVVVLMDMGSALLSTEMALELIDPEMAEHVALCSAPIVEGTMAASVAASAGLPLSAVLEEAAGSLSAKREHLGEEEETPAENEAVQTLDQAIEFEWTVLNPHGLHARPAAAIVSELAGFEAELRIEKSGQQVNAKSLNAIAKLGVKLDDTIKLLASGSDAMTAVEAFKALANNHFGEDVSAAGHEAAEVEIADVVQIEGAIAGIPVCDGIAIGTVLGLESAMPEVPERTYTSEAEEWSLFLNAVSAVLASLKEQEQAATKSLGKEQADIFAAHAMMIADPELADKVKQEIKSGSIAEQALMTVMIAQAKEYASSDSEYMREREADIWDVTKQTMYCFDGAAEEVIELTDNCIIVANDLSPAQTAQLDPEKVAGICLEAGGRTSHSAIIARATGIPCIVKAEQVLKATENGQQVILDGARGHLWLAPDQQTRARLEDERSNWLLEQQAKKQQASKPAITKDGLQVDVLANIGGLKDVKAALENGAEGVGLLRTEFIFQSGDTLPTEDEQYQIYSDIATALEERPLTIRSLDVGGDKPLPAYPMAEEENPFLGLRGVRLCLSDQKLFKPQIKAVLRAAKENANIQLMIPMIAEVEELLAVKQLIAECRSELNLPESEYPMKTGIMIEVPAAVLNANELAKEADFFSIGTNDLTQYVMAADRGNTSVSDLVSYNKSAVIAAIELTCKAAKQQGIPVSMCGEMAGDTEVSEMLIRLGVHKLSASASLLPGLKARIREVTIN